MEQGNHSQAAPIRFFNLVYYEALNTLSEAIARETAIKNLPRNYKIELIEGDNPKWLDLPLE